MFIESVLEICDIHVKRIEYAMNKISKYFPIKPEVLSDLEQDDLAFFDLLVNRFGKLQDYMGSKLFEEILKLAKEEVGLTIIDKIHQLQKIGINIDKAKWFELREMRNRAAHEYPESPEIVAKYLNDIFSNTPELLELYKELKTYSLKLKQKLEQA